MHDKRVDPSPADQNNKSEIRFLQHNEGSTLSQIRSLKSELEQMATSLQ